VTAQIYRIDRFKKQVDFQLVRERPERPQRTERPQRSERPERVSRHVKPEPPAPPAAKEELRPRKPKFFERLMSKKKARKDLP
jgi:hypothetical protein